MNIGTSYQLPSTTNSGQYCNGGGYYAIQVVEIEVYQVSEEGFKGPARFNAIDCPLKLTSFARTPQLPLGALSKPTKVSNMYTTQTSELSSNLLHMAKVAQIDRKSVV